MAPANSQDGVSPYFSKHPEDLQRFPATRSIFNSVLGVWKWVQINRRLVSSVGRAPVCCAGGRWFEP